jgi:diguanylate cyclase (GGDEF)-like protein
MTPKTINKNILEFETRLLEKFLITSNITKEWKEHVGNLLLEVNKVMESYAFFSVFCVKKETYDVDIFWRNAPSDKTKKSFQKIITEKIMKSPMITNGASLKIIHNIVDNSVSLPCINKRCIESQIKSLVLPFPQIGGAIGVGIQSEMASDITCSFVVEGILTTFLNAVGSIKEISKHTKDLEYHATRDPLTDIYNQRMFWDLLTHEIDRSRRYNYKFSLLVIDIDNFKSINDLYGHAFGDKFLSGVVVKIKEVLRQGDIFARYGGDEFAVVLVETNKEQAMLVANRIKDSVVALSIPSVDGAEVRTTSSIGLSVFPDHANNAKDMFIFADNMMYRAKAKGKNKVIMPTHNDVVEVFKDVSKKTLIVTNAIEDKKITPFFQPIINTQTDKIECYEVFGRIETNEGILRAGEFIDITERLGIISKLDLVLMEKAFEKVATEGYKGCLFFNLSPKSMLLDEFIIDVKKLTKEYKIKCNRIVFEMTERDTVKNITLLETFIDNLRAEGFKFAIDDFGSGFSSFHYIKRFPLDFVKIEGEFIKNMISDNKDMAIVKTLLVLAKEFNIKTIAEHVESEDIYKSTKILGINCAQGYYAGKPSREIAST